MINQELIAYIQQARSKGMQDEAIRAELQKNGWKSEDIESSLFSNTQKPALNSTTNQPSIVLPSIDRSKIKESRTEKKSEKILLYNTKSYFWIALFFTMIPVVYMTWKNTRYYGDELKKKLRKFATIYLIVYILIILFGGKLIPTDGLYQFIAWLIIMLPYFYYTNVNEYPTYKKMLDSKIARARASVAPVIIGLIFYALIIVPIILQFISRSLQQGA